MLYANSIEVRFGGLVAVDNVSVHIEASRIHAIIGPNGAGKSTFFNAISGINAPSSGEIRFQGEDITGCQPNEVARMGIGRTFQNIKLFSTLSVLENVLAGCHMNVKSSLFQDMFAMPFKRREEKRSVSMPSSFSSAWDSQPSGITQPEASRTASSGSSRSCGRWLPIPDS
jgi:branched-chain amino acid transport system ATP-binding protein